MFAVVHLPDFPLQAALRGWAELWSAPVALVDPATAPLRVCAVTPPARTRGVLPGVTVTQAQARCGDVQVRARSAGRETATADAVAQCVLAFTPTLEATSPGCWTLDLRALAELKEAGPGVVHRWGERLRAALLRLELRAQVGIGATPNLARHAARWAGTGASSHPGVHVVREGAAWMAGLPVAALDPSPPVAAILSLWGVTTVGGLLRLGLSAVADRLGLEALGLFAAAEVSGIRPLSPLRVAEQHAETQDLEEPVATLEPVLFLLRRFLGQLVRRLEPTGRVVAEMRLELRLESGDAVVLDLAVPDPTRDVDVLFRIWHTRLESVRTDAAVTGVTLSVQPGRAVVRQFQLFQSVVRDPARLQETLGRLEALLGPERVGTPVRVAGHQRDAFRMTRPDFERSPASSPGRPSLLQPVPWRRLRPALPAEVGVRAGRPAWVRSAVASGRVEAVEGPWRASGHWWEAAGAWAREDWDVAVPGGAVLRLSRSVAGWQVTDVLD